MKNAVIFFADGFEEVEAITPLDYLRRAGVAVTSASCGKGKEVTGAHGVKITCDATVAEALGKFPAGADAVVCPGGMPGAANIASCKEAAALIEKTRDGGGITAAICASPAVVFARLGLLAGKTFTCYPGMEGNLAEWGGAESLTAGCRKADKAAVVDGNLITGRGPGAAEEFTLALVEALAGKPAVETLRKQACLR
jgi:4-methyl-5(b-hydroxyethyl)-thiazole monophosphate biosynthesis